MANASEAENIIAYGDKVNSIDNHASSDDAYDSDTSLSSDDIDKQKQEMKRKSFINLLKDASRSKYSPMMINSEISESLDGLDHPPNDQKSFIWGAILMFIASFLFSISTQIIKYNHSFGRESFEIFVFRMFIQLLVTTMVASISVVMNHHYCYQSVSVLSNDDYEGDTTATEYESDIEAELGQLSIQKEKKKKKHKNKNLRKLSSILRGQYYFQKPCFQVRCVYTTVFAKFWRESTSTTKWYILARGLCGGTGAVSYYWAVALLPINDTIMIFSLFPIFTTLLAALILKERVSYTHMCALFVAMIGVLLMCYPSFIFGRDDRDDRVYNITETEWKLLIQGYGFALIGSICYGFVFIFIRLAYKAPTFSLIYSNGIFGLMEAIIICVLFHRFVPIPMWRDWLIALGIGCIGYLAQNAENRSGKYMFASLASLIRVTDVFWEYVWQNMIYSKPVGSIATLGAACLAFSIMTVMYDKHNDIKDIEISSALEGIVDYETEYETDDINDIYHKKRSKAANLVHKICGPSYEEMEVADQDCHAI
eukprot:196952_1